MRLENTSNEPQKVWNEETGKQYVIAAGAIEHFHINIAKLFLEQCPGEVIEYKDIELPMSAYHNDTVWVANNTGNPRFRKTFKERFYNSTLKQSVEREVENPCATPHTLTHVWDPGQGDIVRNGTVVRGANLSSITIKMPPFHRRKLPAHIVHAWQNCLQFGREEMAQAIIVSREPSAYEPNESWELDDILCFANEVESDFSRYHGLRTEKECKTPLELAEQKKKALSNYYFLSINPTMKMPSEKAWKARKRELAAQQLINSKGK